MPSEWLSDTALLTEFRGFEDGKGHSDHILLLYSLALYLGRPFVALETGTRRGRSTQALLAAAEVRDGRVFSCDIDPQWGESVPKDARAKWTFYGENSHDVAKTWAQPLDLLFIDGDHSYEGIAGDFVGFAPSVVDDGFIVCHDTRNPSFGVGKFLHDLEARGFWHVNYIDYGAGTAIVQRVNKKGGV